MSQLPEVRNSLGPAAPIFVLGGTAVAAAIVAEMLGVLALVVLVVAFLSLRNLIGAFQAGVVAALASLVTWAVIVLHLIG